MPYITQEARDKLDPAIDQLAAAISTVASPIAGQRDSVVNYAITNLVMYGLLPESRLSYERLERCIGVLECAKLELYRRLVVPYEDRKAAENGDVYGR